MTTARDNRLSTFLTCVAIVLLIAALIWAPV